MTLRDKRNTLGLTQGQVAEKAGIDRGYYSLIETGKRSVSFKRAKAIAQALGVEIDPDGLFDHILDGEVIEDDDEDNTH